MIACDILPVAMFHYGFYTISRLVLYASKVHGDTWWYMVIIDVVVFMCDLHQQLFLERLRAGFYILWKRAKYSCTINLFSMKGRPSRYTSDFSLSDTAVGCLLICNAFKHVSSDTEEIHLISEEGAAGC